MPKKNKKKLPIIRVDSDDYLTNLDFVNVSSGNNSPIKSAEINKVTNKPAISDVTNLIINNGEILEYHLIYQGETKQTEQTEQPTQYDMNNPITITINQLNEQNKTLAIKNKTNIYCEIIICGNLLNLKKIICDNCLMINIVVPLINNIEYIDCSNNFIQILDLNTCVRLKSLICNNNILNKLSVNSQYLINLHCQYNNLSDLDLSNCLNLKDLYCFYNNIDELNLNKHNDIEIIDCSHNNITNFSIIKNSKIKQLLCSHNQMSDLDLSNQYSLEFIYCSYAVKILYIKNTPKIKKIISNGNHQIEIIK
jgi:hypothetical protein